MVDEDTAKTNPVATDDEPDPIMTSDGAIRQLEKADILANRGANNTPQTDADAQEGMEVISLGKDPSGAPEEDAADTSETSNQRIPL